MVTGIMKVDVELAYFYLLDQFGPTHLYPTKSTTSLVLRNPVRLTPEKRMRMTILSKLQNTTTIILPSLRPYWP